MFNSDGLMLVRDRRQRDWRGKVETSFNRSTQLLQMGRAGRKNDWVPPESAVLVQHIVDEMLTV